MEHDFLDQYAHLSGPVQRLHPCPKIVLAVLTILLVVLTPPTNTARFAGVGMLLAVTLTVSGVPAGFVLRRSLVVLPFVLAVALGAPFLEPGTDGYVPLGAGFEVPRAGLLVVWNVLVKSWLSAITMLLMVSTTPFPSLLGGARSLGVPRIMAQVLAFMYRYLFIIQDELMRLVRARTSRSIGNEGFMWHARTAGGLLGSLFIRSYERGERVYLAMAARGYAGELPMLERQELASRDVAASLVMVLVLACVVGVTP